MIWSLWDALVVACRYGCGNSIHLKCMKIWADHQKSTGATMIRCPLCREDFGSLDVSTLYGYQSLEVSMKILYSH